MVFILTHTNFFKGNLYLDHAYGCQSLRYHGVGVQLHFLVFDILIVAVEVFGNGDEASEGYGVAVEADRMPSDCAFGGRMVALLVPGKKCWLCSRWWWFLEAFLVVVVVLVGDGACCRLFKKYRYCDSVMVGLVQWHKWLWWLMIVLGGGDYWR